MKVTIDSELCQGHNRCYSLAPEIFDVDDEGLALVRDHWDSSNPEAIRHLRLAVANCPERAISIEE